MKKQTLLFFLAKLVTAIISFALVSIRSFDFSALELSDYYVVMKVLSVLYAVFFTWIPESCIRFFGECPDKKSFFSTILFSLLFACGPAITGILICGFIPGCEAVFSYFPYLILLILSQALNDSVSSVFRVSNKPLAYAIGLIVSSLLNLGVFFAIPVSFGIGSIFIAVSVSYLFGFVYGLIVLRCHKDFSVSSFDKNLLKRSLRYSLPLILVWCSIWIFTSSDTFIISTLCPKEQISYYNTAEGIASQSLGSISTAFSFAVLPLMISDYNKGDHEAQERNLSAALSTLMKYMIPATVGLMSISFFLYGSLLNKDYNPGYQGSFLICLFSAGQLFDCVYQTYAKVWNLEEKTKTSAVVSIVSALANFTISFLCVYLFKSYLWAAVITFLTLLIRTAVTVCFLRKRWKLPLDWPILIKSAIASVVMGVCVCSFLYFVGSSIGLLFAGVGLGIVAYFATMFALRGMKEETKALKGIVHRNRD